MTRQSSDIVFFGAADVGVGICRIDVRFVSDDEAGEFPGIGIGPTDYAVGSILPGVFPVIACVAETGAIQTLFVGDTFSVRAQPQSDTVPEPASVALVVLSLAGLGVSRRRRAI